MIITIDDNKTIEQIRREFSNHYPFLCLEFYDKPHRPLEMSSERHRLPHNEMIRNIRKRHNPGAMEIHPYQKTGYIEQQFLERFGLNVQILRYHGDAWVQTAGTDEISLEEQNEVGRNASVKTHTSPNKE